MLREAKNAQFHRHRSLLGRRYTLAVGTKTATAVWSKRAYEGLQVAQQDTPVPLLREDPKTWWLFQGRVYWEDDELSADDVLALVRDRQRRQQRRLERAHAALAVDEVPLTRADGAGLRVPRTSIPREVRLAVWKRDGGRCADCAAAFDLQYDHVIPLALGGASTVENLQILCAPCNQAKGLSL